MEGLSALHALHVIQKNRRTMEFYVMAKSYNCYGGHTTLSPIGQFLLRNAPDFGDAIKEITVTLHFACTGPAKKTLNWGQGTNSQFDKRPRRGGQS
jgi:hypothetical protein